MERFVFVDWSAHGKQKTRVILMERRGFGMVPKSVHAFYAEGAEHIAHEAAKMCAQYNVMPLVDAFGEGLRILQYLEEMLGPNWPPSPPELRDTNTRIRNP